jgi:hypothetical protein
MKVRSDLLCVRQLAQGSASKPFHLLKTFGALWGAIFQSANCEVFYKGHRPQQFGLLHRGGVAGGGWPWFQAYCPVSSAATPSWTLPWTKVMSTWAPWDPCASLLKACTLPLWQTTGTGRTLLEATEQVLLPGLLRSTDMWTCRLPPGSSGSGPWNWRRQLRSRPWPTGFAARFSHVEELLPQGTYLELSRLQFLLPLPCWFFKGRKHLKFSCV